MTAAAPQRILIVRLSAMGDVIHAMPAVAALRRAHPALHIGWAIDPAWAPLLDAAGDHPLVDVIHRVPFKKWSRALHSPATWREMRAARRELAAARYDVALDMQGGLRSAWTLRWSRAPRQMGEAAPRESIARFLYQERIPHSGVHVIEQDLELAGAVFGEQLDYAPAPFPHDFAAEKWADDLLTAHPAQRHAVLLPGAGWGAKRWPAERFGAVASGLRATNFHCFVNAGPGEQSLAATAVAASRAAASAVSPTLPQLIALLRRAALVIGGDTGPLHLACALQVPTVGIYGPTSAARNGPFGAPHRVLRHQESVRDHTRRHAPDPGLLTITSLDVLASAHELLHQVRP
jgi:heptosyltransferase-1